jgi:hypothetical protein
MSVAEIRYFGRKAKIISKYIYKNTAKTNQCINKNNTAVKD